MQDTRLHQNQNDTESRINEIESKLAFLEHSLQQINDVVVLQQNKLDELDRAVQLVMQRVKDIVATSGSHDADAVFSDPASEKPPHY